MGRACGPWEQLVRKQLRVKYKERKWTYMLPGSKLTLFVVLSIIDSVMSSLDPVYEEDVATSISDGPGSKRNRIMIPGLRKKFDDIEEM